jgi:hypothetical protein
MPVKRTRKKVSRYPHEEEWLREFLGYHGTDAVTSFVESDLKGVSLTRIVRALICGSVISAEKCNEPGTICEVEYLEEEGDIVGIEVHFVSNEETLRILGATIIKEDDSEPDRAA